MKAMLITREREIGLSGLNVNLSINTLKRLLSEGHLCVAELNALDSHTKQQLWHLCLETCRHALVCDALKPVSSTVTDEEKSSQ
ncbi:hypothetical protein [Shewanella sp. NIFS-20-20]|uniref:hypothetical protein n=1 Tax=Shewanella sp. NIFS-20-20 TaxID=2853806 RepID=UPI001C456D79|nr:hypothetical protein [Shewanella sp. NIFS-20-20]MBV7315687.1 hypothetical protein [Shewanella sp. NIFS-20-20]